MDDTLNSDLVKIEEWGRANRVEFNAMKNPMLSVIAQANVRSWPKRLYGWYGDCKIGDS